MVPGTTDIPKQENPTQPLDSTQGLLGARKISLLQFFSRILRAIQLLVQKRLLHDEQVDENAISSNSWMREKSYKDLFHETLLGEHDSDELTEKTITPEDVRIKERKEKLAQISALGKKLQKKNPRYRQQLDELSTLCTEFQYSLDDEGSNIDTPTPAENQFGVENMEIHVLDEIFFTDDELAVDKLIEEAEADRSAKADISHLLEELDYQHPLFSIASVEKTFLYLTIEARVEECISKCHDDLKKNILETLKKKVSLLRLQFVLQNNDGKFDTLPDYVQQNIRAEEKSYFEKICPDDTKNKKQPLVPMTISERKAFNQFRATLPKKVTTDYLNRQELRGVNQKHREMYKTDQEQYVKRSKNLALYAFFSLNKNTTSSIKLLKKLGQGRRSIAKLDKNDDADEFGTPRPHVTQKMIARKSSVWVYTQLNNDNYQVYNKRLTNSYYPKNCSIKTKNKLIITTVSDNTVYNRTNNNDDAWNLLGKLLDDARKKDPEPTLAELGKRIGIFHWYFAQITPFSRGSAAVAEMITDALWLHHGYIPPVTNMIDEDNKRSLDLEALVPIDGPGKQDEDQPGDESTPKEPYPEDVYSDKYLSFMGIPPDLIIPKKVVA